MNRITATLLCLVLCLAGTMVPTDAKVFAADTVANRVIVMTIGSKILKVNDVDGEIDAGPQIKWDRTFSPIAPIINALGGTSEWDAKTRRVTIDLDTKIIVLTISSRYAVVNGKSVSIDSNPDLVPYVQAPGRTMLPVRFIAEQFGALVTWNSTLQRVTLALKVTSPPPLTRPFPAPVTTRTVTVPASIDATGTTDVLTALKAFILGVPDGSLINFPAAGIYKITSALRLEGRHNLIIDGNGCTLQSASVDPGSELSSLWYERLGGSDIWIKNFVLIGSSPYPGVFTDGVSPTDGQQQHGVIVGADRTEVSGCTISALWGDGVEVNSGMSVWFHDNHVISAGRNGVSVISGTNVIAERNALDVVGGFAFDVEPDVVTDSCINVVFRNNTVGTWGFEHVFAASNSPKTTVDGIVIDNNIVTGGSIRTYIDSVGAVRMTHITFTNNVGKVATTDAPLNFQRIDGLTVTGNVQPLSSGHLIWTVDCTGAR